MSKPHIVILGAGPAGVGAAYRLRREDRARVTVIEQQPVVGGNAGSFEVGGERLDYGSHRLHPSCDPLILADIRRLLGDDLLDRPRHGRIRLRGKWIHFPLAPLDLLLKLDGRFALGVLRDMTIGRITRRKRATDTFASVLMQSLGPTICQEFYFSYARKIWGRDTSQLSGIQARRRVSARSFAKLLRKVVWRVPGLKSETKRRFFYPRHGYGQISEAYANAAQQLGAEFLMRTRVTSIQREGENNGAVWVFTAAENKRVLAIEADQVWSTIPITLLSHLVKPFPPPDVAEAANRIEYRSMLLIYLQLPTNQFTEYDAHYFPAADITITRLSEPKNYSATPEPRGTTTLCAELPCSPDDHWWTMTDAQLAEVVATDLANAGIPLPHKPIAVHVKRLPHAYPIYAAGYEEPFETLDTWADSLPNVLTYGRQGLFAHDNTHHALFMAYRAVDCLRDGVFDRNKWQEYRGVFATHVVED